MLQREYPVHSLFIEPIEHTGGNQSQHTEEPPCLPERRIDHDVETRDVLRWVALGVLALNQKCISAGWEVRIYRLEILIGHFPIFLEPIQLVADDVGIVVAEPGKLDRDRILFRREFNMLPP